ncbi:MAG: pirin family protein [Alphaproteobacteria bacterium]|nr:pirin family protein [Alphaproteobacteria bacterium]
MIEVTPFERLGRFRNEWLNARHHFSFGSYVDRSRMGWGALRVWNDDEIAPGTGFDLHPHRDMEIVTYVRQGTITHRDNLGNVGHTSAGNVQVMSAGTGIVHAEHNLGDEPVRLFQIWIVPQKQGVAPRWEMRNFPEGATEGKLHVMASGRAGEAGAMSIHQDAAVLGARLKPAQSVTYKLGQGRRAYVVSTDGAIRVNGVAVPPRAGVAINDERELTIEANEATDVVLVDVP